jgi:Predicted hydrolases or acyltransferases (alpha/beta hydrolase superfamily)
MKRAYADIPEGQIHYRIEGAGEVTLLLHAGVTSSDEYSRVIPFLSKNYCAIAMDFLGNGDSDKPLYQYQLLDHARTAISFMDRLGLKKAIVVGQHFGGKVGLEMAVTWPERINKLVLSSIGYPEAEEAKTNNDPLNFTSQVEIKMDGSHVMEWWRRSAMWGHPLDIVEDRFLEYVKAGPRGEEIHWAGNFDPRPKLPLVRCPTLVLSATRDPMCAVADKIHKLIPRSKLTIIENGPIDIDRAWPKEFAEAILSFLHTSVV